MGWRHHICPANVDLGDGEVAVSGAGVEAAAGSGGLPAAAPEPLLRIVRGLPPDTDGALEVAVLSAVLTAAITARGSGEAEPSTASGWAARESLVRRPLNPGPRGWWASGLPGR